MPMEEQLFHIFLFLCAVQLAFPFVAGKIKSRFLKLGYVMQSDPVWSWLNVTKFWSEAREQNSRFNDPVITKYLRFRTAWWVAVGLTFIAFITIDLS
jgi:hypothetical protein